MGPKKQSIIIGVVAGVLSVGLFFLFLYVDLIPHPASPERATIDRFLQVLFAIASVFFAVIVTVIVASLLLYRRKAGDTADGPPVRGYAPLEIVWTAVPLVIVLILGTYGGIIMERMMSPPPPPQTEMEIDVLAFRYGWQFTYPEYKVQSFELRLPVDRPVLLKLQSKDVIHAFWVPEFGPKQDAVPGMMTELRFTPTVPGQYRVYCSQLCGAGHTYMLAPVQVVSWDDFQKWIDSQPKQAK